MNEPRVKRGACGVASVDLMVEVSAWCCLQSVFLSDPGGYYRGLTSTLLRHQTGWMRQ